MTKADALKTLTEGKHRITRTREAMLDVILKRTRPFSATDLFHLLEPAHVDLVTVYRNLGVFEAAGLICRADFSDETARFTLAGHAHRYHHHHVVCRACGRVAAIESCGLAAQEKALTELGFRNLEHRLEFTGTCRRCT